MRLLSRRALIRGGVLAGAAALLPCAVHGDASQPSTPVAFDVPPGACDCHTHIFGEPQRFPFTAGRVYTPEPASIGEMRRLHRALRISRVVIVQPSVYGTDNRCTLDAIAQLGPGARGIAVIDDHTPDAALDEMGRAGMRGIRINLETAGQTDPAIGRRRLQAAIARVKGRNWNVQIYTRLSVIDRLADQVSQSPVPIVFDHFGGAQASLGIGQPGFGALLNLVRSGHAYVKVSGSYRSSTQTPDYSDVAPLARALVDANPERILWGTDWPHPDSSLVAGRNATDLAPLLHIDDGRVFNQLAVWVPDAAKRNIILVDNPARLYGF
jgi:predicted TIM-barrel fold metal-dependent hydrolase